ncbi:MAG: GNAT family N-acetyltransferase [Gammaproteobacteria bacterium]
MTKSNLLRIKTASWGKDKNKLQDIRHTVFVREQSVPERLEWDEYDETATHFLAFIDNLAIATARLKSDGQIGRMAVLSAYRNQNIGYQLLGFVLETAHKQGLKSVFLHAQVQVIDFYKKRGFVERGEVFMDANIPHREMIKTVNDRD